MSEENISVSIDKLMAAFATDPNSHFYYAIRNLTPPACQETPPALLEHPHEECLPLSNPQPLHDKNAKNVVCPRCGWQKNNGATS